MSSQGGTAWRCTVCGYIHRGAAPPEVCPVCGASKENFEYFEEPAAQPAATGASSSWRCINCSYQHQGDSPPDRCPVCGAPADRFEQLASPRHVAAGVARRVVVVGGGIAGVSAAESARQSSPDSTIQLISAEGDLPQYRLNLTRYLAGEVGTETLPLHPRSWYEEQRIELRLGVEVLSLGLGASALEIKGGETVPYDRLILAVGAHPFVPPIEGADLEGVRSFRTQDDTEALLSAASAGATFGVIGGGILGLETAAALARQGAQVTVFEGFGWLLPRQLNERAAALLQRSVEAQGIKVRTGVRISKLYGQDGHVAGVEVDGGEQIGCDQVVFSTGIRPNTALARKAGLDVGKGVVVDDFLRTSHDRVYAAGDVAEHRGMLYGLWTPSMYQGSIAGLNAVGVEAEFGGVPRSNILKVLGLDMFSIGVVDVEDGSYGVVDDEPTADSYRRFIFRDSRMVGAILMGDTSASGAVNGAVEDGRDFSAILGATMTAADVVASL